MNSLIKKSIERFYVSIKEFLGSNYILFCVLSCSLFSIFQPQFSFAAEKLAVSVCDTGSGSCRYRPPSEVLEISDKLQLSQIVFTISNISLRITDTSTPAVNIKNWGVIISSPGDSSFTPTICSANTSCDPSITVQVDENHSNINSTGATSPYTATGTVSVMLLFNNTSQLPSWLYNMIEKAGTKGIGIAPIFDLGGGSNSRGSAAIWKSDLGALIHAPKITSVQALDGGFVLNLAPPSDTSSVCPSKDKSSCTNENSTTDATALISTKEDNSVSGYLLAYWKDGYWDSETKTYSSESQTCFSHSSWIFNANPISYRDNEPDLSCVFKRKWNPDLKFGGISSNLGCSAKGFLPNSTLDLDAHPDKAAVPALSDFNSNLRHLINNPGQTATAGCLQVVYVPGTQNSWSHIGINNGDVYGAIVWSLNSSYPTPTVSLAHSKVSYITGVGLALGSLDKDPGLPKSRADCFVVTAASGDVGSKAVFYWRLLRDEYLTPMGFTPFYYRHGPKMAAWLDRHPSLKPPLNAIFETSGYSLYHLSRFIKEQKSNLSNFFKAVGTSIQNLWEQKASALELTADSLNASAADSADTTDSVKPAKSVDTATVDKSSTKSPQTQDQSQKQSQNQDLDKKNENKKSGSKKKYPTGKGSRTPLRQPPGHDFNLFGGAFFPTQDKVFYNRYYPSQPYYFVTISSGLIFWTGNIGYSVGGQVRYMTASEDDKVEVMGNHNKQSYTRNITFTSISALGNIRYRNPSWSYLQPSVYAAVGAQRFRESTNPTDQSVGITQWSLISEIGVNLDVSLTKLANFHEKDLTAGLQEILFRFSGAYNNDLNKALSSTGYFIQGGLVFLLD